MPHPSDNVELTGNYKKNQVLLGTLDAEFDITKNLTYSASFGLEILNQDVSCTHGATVAPVDPSVSMAVAATRWISRPAVVTLMSSLSAT